MHIFPISAASNDAIGVAASPGTPDTKVPRVLRRRLVLVAALLMALGTTGTARAANFVVQTGADNSGAGTLRDAITKANAQSSDDTITFAFGTTITLSSALPVIAGNGTLSIAAPGVGVIISGNNTFRVFEVGSGANVTLTGLTIRNGRPTSDVFRIGGGIFNGGKLLLDSCTLTGNSANYGGAIRSETNLSGVTLTIRNCTLSGNTVTDEGAGSSGGAIDNAVGLTVIESSTISGNSAPAGNGGGVSSSGDANTRTSVHNSIIAGNTGSDVDLVFGTTNSFQSGGYNLIGTGSGTAPFTSTADVRNNTNPGLAALASNGGGTQTMALLATSPARDAGDTDLLVDQRGVMRPTGSKDDKGAFEYQTPDPTGAAALIVTTTTDVTDIDGLISLREAINTANADGVNSAISFGAAAFAAPRKTITLNSALPDLAGNGTLSITAPLAGVNISGNNARRVLQVASNANVTLTGLTISGGNAGSSGGGGVNNLGGTLVLDSCTLSGNSAGVGGAIQSATKVTGGVTTLRNCTLAGNTATGTSSVGGAIYNIDGLLEIESTSISGNTAPANSGGGVASGSFSTRTSVHNSIIAGNTGGDVVFVFGNGANTFESTGYNLIGVGNATTVFNVTGDVRDNTNPGLSALAENGGPTQTMALLSNSPAVNTGDTTLLVDQRGETRSNGGIDDKGAFELLPPLTVSIGNAPAVAEGSTVGGNLVFPVTLSRTSISNVTVNYAVTGGSATASDYGTATGTLLITAGQSTGNITIPIIGDLGLEPDETVTVTLSAPTNASLGTSAGTGTIQNDDSGLIVTTSSDSFDGSDGDNSFREAIVAANADGVDSAITFNALAFVAPRKTITLTSVLPSLAVNGTLSITAPVAGVVVSGNNARRVFVVDRGTNVTMTGLTISGGNAGFSFSGGGIFSTGTLLLDSCTLSGNTAGSGGAIFSRADLFGSATTLRNCTLSGNNAFNRGSAIYNDIGLTIIESCTITSNDILQSDTGSGVASGGDTDTRTSVRNSIIAGNTGSDVQFVFGDTNSFDSSGYNLIGTGNATGNFTGPGDVTGNIDPGLAALAENGGPTPTRALLASSPALDTGDTTLTVDQRGVLRPIGGVDDKGAFESGFLPPSVVSIFRADVNPNQSSSVRFTVTFNRSVTGVDATDFTPVRTGTNSGALTVSVTGSGALYTVTVSGISGTSGTIGLNLADDDTILDLSGNKLGGEGAGNGNFTGQFYTRNNLASSPVALISEFRFRGLTPGDEYVEIYNTTSAPLDISNWKLRTNTGTGAEPIFQTATVGAGTPAIPAFGHFLFTGPGYSLGSYGASNGSLGADASDDSGAALLDLNNQIQDAVGFASGDPTLRKDAGLPSAPGANGQHAWMRDFVGASPKNSGDTVADWVLLATNGAGVAGTGGTIAAQLGAPNPEGLASLINANSRIFVALLDPLTDQNSTPNRIRTGSGNAGNLLIRRTLKNNSASAVTRIRLLVTRITSQGSPAGITSGAQADVRLMGQGTESVPVQGQPVTVYGTTLEAPSASATTSGSAPNTVVTGGGGGLGSSLAFDLVLATPLQPGQTRAYAFNLQVAKSGSFLVAFNILANTAAPSP